MESEMPKKCPFMKECKRRLLYSTWKIICNTEGWTTCWEDAVREWKKEFERSPSEWKLVSELEK